MCWICGAFNFDRHRAIESSTLKRMAQTIVHRGPDDEGFYLWENVGLGMRRLSIIDLHTGQQPVSNEDRTLWIVYNGEIYNYRELRDELAKRGHVFRSRSDTETIVHLFEEFGSGCVRQLRGMYAFALWDQRRRRLLLARDRLGIKPIYYTVAGGSFVFASEIKALLDFPGVRCEINRKVLPEYLAFGYLAGADTFFDGVRCLPPGHLLEIDESGQVRVEQYWDVPLSAKDDSHPSGYYVQRYRELFEESVSAHLISDVPLGVLLSGGLDSSAVAAVATRQRGPLQTFSVGYRETPYNELPYARAVASHLGSIHHEVLLGPEEFFAALPKLVWHEDKPLAWPSSVSLYFVSKLAREHVTVVLTGEGSDETLAGYERYALTVWNARLDGIYRKFVPSALREWVRGTIAGSNVLRGNIRRKLQHTFAGRNGRAWESLYFDNFLCAFSEQQQRALLAEDAEAGAAYANSLAFWNKSSGDILAQMLYTDMKTYLVELLMKQDRMSMATSLESRVPFLDHVLVEYAAQIPARLNLGFVNGKRILKAAMKDLLPKAILDRRKMGFPTPWKSWLTGSYSQRVEQLLTEPRTQARELFRPETIQQMLWEHSAGRHDHADRLWRLLNLELWHRSFIDREAVVHTAV